MGRHSKPSPRIPQRAAVAAVVVTVGGLSVSDSGAFQAVVPASAESSTPVGVPAVSAPALLAASAPALAPVAVPTDAAPRRVAVAQGDTLDSLARANDQSWQELWGRNLATVSNPNVLSEGQQLSLDAPVAPLPTAAPDPAPAATAPATSVSEAPAAASEVADDAPAPAASSSSIADIARTYIGIPYQWGGKSRSAVDCSGLVYLVLKEAGLTDTYRTSGTLRDWVTPVSSSEAAPGDLVFGPGHVGIYIGNGQMIDAPRAGKNVGVRDVYSTMYFYGRIPV